MRTTRPRLQAGDALAATTGSITDTSGHVWTLAIGADGMTVDVDGAPAGFTAEVAELVEVDGQIWHENTSSEWYVCGMVPGGPQGTIRWARARPLR